MNWVDIIIVLVLVVVAVRGWRAGLIQLILTFAGFISGLVVGSWLVTLTVPHFSNQLVKMLVLLLVELCLALLFVVLAERVAKKIKAPTVHFTFMGANSSFGSILAVIFTLFSLWLAASVLANIESYGISRNVSRSLIVQELDYAMPPAPDVFAKLEYLISPTGLPDVFLGVEPQHTTISPKNKVNDKLTLKATSSVVKIQGAGCGGVVKGTGFVVAKDTVVTAAHVVAGISRPQVLDKTKSYFATTVAFDPELDMAVLKVKNLPDPPLLIADKHLPDLSSATVMGFAGGKSLVIQNVPVIDNLLATGRNIYDAGQVDRMIYEIQGKFEGGESGGPLLKPDGTVAGVMFGIALSQDNIGYVLIIDQFTPLIYEASLTNRAVSTGACAAGVE